MLMSDARASSALVTVLAVQLGEESLHIVSIESWVAAHLGTLARREGYRGLALSAEGRLSVRQHMRESDLHGGRFAREERSTDLSGTPIQGQQADDHPDHALGCSQALKLVQYVLEVVQ